MNSLSFIKVTIIPESPGGTRIMDMEIMIPVTSILCVRKNLGFEYEVVLKPEYLQQISDHYFGKTAHIKEIRAKIKDEAIFY